MYKLLLGGSPCTYWSIAQSKNRETEPNGLGWELFKNYLIAREKYNPDYFLYENNFSMDNKIRDEITRQLGVEPIMINSALVSAQSRKRLYWTNIPNVQLPKDKGIFLKDILESGTNLTQDGRSYCLTATYSGACASNTIERNQRTMIAEPTCVAQRGRYSESGNRSKKISDSEIEQYYEARSDGKTNTLTTVIKDNGVAEPVILQNSHGFNKGGIKTRKAPTLTANGDYTHNNRVIDPIPLNDDKGKCRTIKAQYQNTAIANTQYSSTFGASMVAEPLRIGDCGRGSQGTRIYSHAGKSVTLCGQGGGLGAKTGLYAIPTNSETTSRQIYEVRNGEITVKKKTYPIKLKDGFYIIRLLTVAECKRLQTVPEDYIMPCSNSQNYKMLGNGWTVDVIAHILSYIPDISKSDVEVLSMYDGMSCGHIALDKLGANVNNYYATEIDKYAIKTTFKNYPKTVFLGDAFNVRKDDFKIEPPTVERKEIKQVSGEQLSIF